MSRVLAKIESSVVVVGAGVVGSAVALSLSKLGLACVVVDSEERECTGISSRNSGVVHAGIYYPKGSLKSSLCIQGNRLLQEWCEKRALRYSRIGKLIVAQADEIEELEGTFHHAKDCGAEGLKLLSARELQALEPDVSGAAAILSPRSGIVDAAQLTRSLVLESESLGTTFVFRCRVNSINVLGPYSYELLTSRGVIRASLIINCSGLYADHVATMVGIQKYRVYPWRGDYFKLKQAPSTKKLVYPSKPKNAPGLGIHLTVDIAGAWKLGPDVEACQSKEDFSISPQRAQEKAATFLASAQRFLKGLTANDLSYDYCGIRPKLRSPEDKTEKDFVISEDLPGFVNLVGIESPGLTASLAIGQKVVSLFESGQNLKRNY